MSRRACSRRHDVTLAHVLEETRKTLEANGVEEAAVEADLFLMKALGVDRAGLSPRLSES